MIKVSILGSTGSIGSQALDVISQYPDKFKVSSLAAGDNVSLLEKQILQFSPGFVSVKNENTATKIRNNHTIPIESGEKGLLDCALFESDILLVAITGTAALLPTIAAIKQKKAIAIASKEILVSAGDIVMKLARENNVPLIPVDSEHSAILQLLKPKVARNKFIDYQKSDVKNIILTASGGSFRDLSLDEMKDKKAVDALKHPTWSMGDKITIDSTTMMNKGLEVIEASHLFDIPINKIKVLIHPQSYIHGLVEYNDNSLISHMGPSDMKIPIAHALNFCSDKIEIANLKKQTILDHGKLDFHDPDNSRFPALQLAYDAFDHGGTYPAVLNAANEEAVALFLKDKIKFLEIIEIINKTLDNHSKMSSVDLESVLGADKWARNFVYTNFEKRN